MDEQGYGIVRGESGMPADCGTRRRNGRLRLGLSLVVMLLGGAAVFAALLGSDADARRWAGYQQAERSERAELLRQQAAIVGQLRRIESLLEIQQAGR